jgi:RNA polymerase sigma-70 factor, ECF subfamily
MRKSHSSKKQIEPAKINTDKESLFLEMVDKYQDGIFRYLFFRVSNRNIALDITQDTFTKTWKYLTSGNDIEYPEAFLYRTAKNALVDHYKKEKPYSLDTMMEEGFDPSHTKDEDEIIRQDEIAEIREILENLDEEDRHIIYLRYTEEKPIEEIAQLYDKTPNAMTVQIHRIIKNLIATKM